MTTSSIFYPVIPAPQADFLFTGPALARCSRMATATARPILFVRDQAGIYLCIEGVPTSPNGAPPVCHALGYPEACTIGTGYLRPECVGGHFAVPLALSADDLAALAKPDAAIQVRMRFTFNTGIARVKHMLLAPKPIPDEED